MKITPFFKVSLVFFYIVFLLSACGKGSQRYENTQVYENLQDYTKWGLPEGVTSRLGKGRLTGNIAYSPDGTWLAIASSIGVWLYDVATDSEISLLTGHTV